MVSNTSIHQALGETDPLDLGMIHRAVEAGVREDQRLDWKREPYTRDEADELAKDVAALANAQGGLLVIGVAENRATGTATKVMPFELTDGMERQMRAWLHQRISPHVPSVAFHPLASDEDTSRGVLAVSVLESPDMPHMVGADKACGFPFRVGTQTHWMREFDLERAYRQRFDRRASDEQHLSTLIGSAVDHLDLSSGCWIVAAARPVTLRSAGLPRLDKAAVVEILTNSIQDHSEVSPRPADTMQVIRSLDNVANNPRPGLRCWIAAYRAASEPSNKARGVYASLHDDGALVLAAHGGEHPQEQIEGRVSLVEYVLTGLATDLANLMEAASERSDVEGGYLVRVDLIQAGEAPFAYVAPHRQGGFTLGLKQPTWSLDVQRFLPVDLVAPEFHSIEERRTVAREIAGDVVAQFGIGADSLGW